MIPRVNCWVQSCSPQHPPLSPLPHSIHLHLFLYPFHSAVSLSLFLFSLCLTHQLGCQGVKRISTSSFLVFRREYSGFEFRSASSAHTHGLVLVPGLELSPRLLRTLRGERWVFGREREGRRYLVMKGDAVRKCGWGGCARDAVVGWHGASC